MDDLEVEDLMADDGKEKKRVNGKRKGNRVELELCKLLEKHFGRAFSRSVGSGNRGSQVSYMPSHARKTFTGDICVPEGFKWVVECKGGYDNDVDFSSVLGGGCFRIDEFIKQSKKDEKQSGRKPMICWKRTRKPWIVFVKKSHVDVKNFKHHFAYNDWIVVSLNELLSLYSEDSFWFDSTEVIAQTR